MHIKAAEVLQRLEELYALGAMPDGAHTRLAFSPEDAQGRRRFTEYFDAIGVPTRVDEAGNLIARLEGSDPRLPAILIGSHLDTVPDGGKYDGALGCVAGWAVCAVLKQAGRVLRHPLEVVVFTDEEGARFGNGMFGSCAFCGALEELNPEDVDILGMTRGQVLADFGIDLHGASAAKRDRDSVHCCLELHVEQGASLHQRGIPVGVVSTISGVRRYEARVAGQANHSGSTRMEDRKDALVAASRFIGAIPERTAALGGDYTVATVGTIQVSPGAVNVIPGGCTFSLEMRDQSDGVLDALEQAFQEELARQCSGCGCTFSLERTAVHPPAPMAAFVQAAIEDACREADTPYAVVPSGAFHDSMMLSGVFPAGMLFVPSVGGISHSPAEYTEPEAIEVGCNVLLKAVLRLDDGQETRDDYSGKKV